VKFPVAVNTILAPLVPRATSAQLNTPGAEQEMFAAAENLQFETAARLRDELKRLQGLAGDAIPASTRGGSPRSERPSARPKARSSPPRKRR